MANRPQHHEDRFPSAVEYVNGERRRVRIIMCAKCGETASLRDNTGSALPADALARKFSGMGWSLGGRDVCPRCWRGKKPMTPSQRRAAFCAINNVSAHKREREPAMALPATSPPMAERSASADERRRIRDALDTHYDEEAGRYRSSFSDKSLAAKLDVPAKWVTDLREAGGYGPDVNEASAARSADVDAVRLALADLQGELLSRFDALEGRVKKLLREDGRMDV